MEAKWKKFTEDQIVQIVKESRSYREVCIKMGYSGDGGSISRIKDKIDNEWKIDTSHFLGQGWNKENYNYNKFQEETKYNREGFISPLIKLRGRKCEKCERLLRRKRKRAALLQPLQNLSSYAI